MKYYIIIVTLSVAFSGFVILFYDTLTNFILYTKTFHTFFSVDYSLLLYETVNGIPVSKNGWDPYTSIQIYIYGGICGMLLAWGLGNYISRKSHLIIGSILISLSSFLLVFNITTSRYFYYAIHFVGGIGTAILRVISPVFLAEIATKSKRGMIISTFQTMKYLGRVLAFIMIIYLINHDNAKFSMSDEDMKHQWDKDHNPKTFSHETFSYPYSPSNYSKNFLKFSKIFPSSFFLFLIFYFIPNTPRYLFYSKKYNKGFKILYRLYTNKKLVIISEEDLPESFLKHIYRYRQKLGMLFGNGSNNCKISPITDDEEENLDIYSHSIYSNSNCNKINNSSTKTLTSSSPTKNDYRILDEEDQIDDLVSNIEKNQEISKKLRKERNKEKKKEKEINKTKEKEKESKREREEEGEDDKKRKKEKEKLEHMKRHRKERSEPSYNKIAKYITNDSLDITISTNDQKDGKPIILYNNHTKPIKISSNLNENENIDKDFNHVKIMKKLNNNQRVYSKTKKELIPKGDNSNVVINIGSLNKELPNHHHKHRRYHTEPLSPNNDNESSKKTNNSDLNEMTIIINRDIYKVNPDSKRKKHEKDKDHKNTTSKKPSSTLKSKNSDKNEESTSDTKNENGTEKNIKFKKEIIFIDKEENSTLKETSNSTLTMKASSSESLAYHQFNDLDFEPIVSDHILEISKEIEIHNEFSILQLYWGQLKIRLGMIIIMNITQQLFELSIFISYFNLLSETILSNYLNILYFFLTEFFLYIPINLYFSGKNRKYMIFIGLITIVVTYGILLFLMYKLKNFYVYFSAVLVILFNSTWGTIPIIYQSEIFPTRARITGSAIGCLVSQLCNLIFYMLLPKIYKLRHVIVIFVIIFVIIFSVYSALFMRDTSKVEIEDMYYIFMKMVTPKTLTKKLKKISSIKNINPIKKVSFAIINRNNTNVSIEKFDEHKSISL